MTEYIKTIWKPAALFLLCCGIMTVVLFLYDCPTEPILYGGAICLLLSAAAFLYGYLRFRSRRRTLERILKELPLELDRLPAPENAKEALEQEMIQKLNVQRMEAEEKRRRSYSEMTDYYTMWVHQIKTPIAALRLLLSEKPQENRAALAEVFRVEEYVEMVLGYLRTEDMSADMRFEPCSLDAVIREQIHKYASVFIAKKLTITYEGVSERVLTDPKWLGFVIGQCLSNALKYTKTGGITIALSETAPHTLLIRDTGIGIRPEDLPRVFERGFTGCNGRGENRSTGIGLYLSKKIMTRLGHTISITSVPGKQTEVALGLGRKEQELF